jgi:hypothetical protein
MENASIEGRFAMINVEAGKWGISETNVKISLERLTHP